MKIILLDSSDGTEYVHPILTDEETPDLDKVEALIDRVQRANPDEWTWDEDMEPALKAAGYTILDWVHGPQWD